MGLEMTLIKYQYCLLQTRHLTLGVTSGTILQIIETVRSICYIQKEINYNEKIFSVYKIIIDEQNSCV